MFLKDLLAQRGELASEAAPLMAKDKAEDDELTDEELVRFDAIVVELEGLDAEIKAKEDSRAARAQAHGFLETQIKAGTPNPSGRQATPNVPTPTVTDVKLLLEDDPAKGFATPRAFFHDVLMAGCGWHHRVQHKDAMAFLESGNEMLAAVGSDEQREGSDPFGGFLLPVAFSPDLLKIDPEDDPMAGRTTQVPMQVPSIKIPVRVDKDHSSSVAGGLSVSRTPETAATAASQMKYEQLTLTAHKLTGLSYVTDELMSDSPISVAALLAAGFSDEFNSVIIDERLSGTGVGEFMGVMSSGCLITVNKEDGQTASTLVFENIVKMRARSWKYGKAIWLANHDTIPQLMFMNQNVGTGGVIVWQPSAREDHPDVLLGRPLVFTEYVKSIGAKGDIVLGTWSEYLEGTLQPLQSAESIHVRFVNMEKVFRFTLRNAGAPWWRSALTPKNGSTLSPFVTLQART